MMKNQRESVESVVTLDDSFMGATEGLIAMEEMDNVEGYPSLECIVPSEGQAPPTMNVGQSNILHFGYEEEGISRTWIAQEDNYSLLECIEPLQEQALHAVNAGQSNVQYTGRLAKGISSIVMDEEAQLSLVVSAEPP